tara:strand:+ start:2968 stop:3609 length:642 start_codon:yes stop_codon:yes gene_type:complete
MGTIEDAIHGFESLGFGVEHMPYIPPIGDKIYIAKLRKVLVGAAEKEKAFLESELRLQTEGAPEQVDASKSFDSFTGFRWTSDKRPYMLGSFKPEESIYNIVFHARFPERIDDAEMLQVFLGRNVSLKDFDESDREIVGMVLQTGERIGRKMARIDNDVAISGSGLSNLRLFLPPFNLNVKSSDLEESHRKLLDVMSKLGYQEGNVYRPVEVS